MKLLSSVVLILLLTQTASAQRVNPARTVIDAMIAALGGQAFLDVREIHTTGRFFAFSKGELTSGDVFADYIKFPDMERTEFGKEKNRTININKGAEGWVFNEKEKEVDPQPATVVEDFVVHFRTSFDYVTRFVLNEPRTTMLHTGVEFVDFKRADVVEIRDADKNLIRFYIDRDTHLPLKVQVRRTDESTIREEHLGNWHKFQGITTPLFVSRYTDGVKTLEMRLDNAAYNRGLADTLFAPPVTTGK